MTKTLEEKLDDAIRRTDAALKLIDEVAVPYQFKTFSPKAFGIMDALDQMPCQPSQYYKERAQRIEYICGYLSVKPEDRGAKAIGMTHGLRLDDDWEEMHADALAVDEAQSEKTDWRG